MKNSNILLNICLLSLSSGLVACSNESVWGEPEPETPGKDEVINIEVKIADFDDTGDKDATRAIQSVSNIRFESGDAIGFTTYNGSTIVDNNIKITYDGSKWTAASQLKGIGRQYYAYYPYDASCSGVTSDAALKAKFPVTADQSTKELYKKCDIMRATGTAAGTISISLNHIRSCISMSDFVNNVYHMQYGDPNGKKIVIKSERYEWSYTVNVQNTAHNKVIANFFRDVDGVYRCIVEPGTSQAYDLCLTPNSGGEMISRALNDGRSSYLAGTRYNHDVKGERMYSWQDLSVNDVIFTRKDEKKLQLAPGSQMNGREIPGVDQLGRVLGYYKENNKLYCYIQAEPTYWLQPSDHYENWVHKTNLWDVVNDYSNNRESLLNNLFNNFSPTSTITKNMRAQVDELNQLTSQFPNNFGKWGLPWFVEILKFPNISHQFFLPYYQSINESTLTFEKYYYNGNQSSPTMGIITQEISYKYPTPSFNFYLYNIFTIDL